MRCRPRSEQFTVALYQRLSLIRRKRLAELISACIPHAENEIAVRTSETPHERGMVPEVLLQLLPLMISVRHEPSLTLAAGDRDLCQQIRHC